MILRAGLILMLWAGVALAQGVTVAVEPNSAGLIEASPEAMVKKLRSGPDAFLRDAAKLIYGYGTVDGINAAGIDGFVALERARIRARVMQAYLGADMDNDGDAVRAEIVTLVAAMAAPKRGAVLFGFEQADADQNAVLSQVELRGFAQGVALNEMSDEDALRLQGLMTFDLDGNGFVTMPEVSTAVQAILDQA